MESQNIQLTEPTIQEKAATFENVQALDGWIRRWKERKNITFKTLSGESNSVNETP